ncbi:MAG: hypothetical protein JO359_15645 [Candidatus Eremiobacteraeota bacterium]|nr:hypothetical protein [Candidatus Eremiobacteraeota bacterium]
MRTLLTLAAATVLTVALSACGGGSGTGSSVPATSPAGGAAPSQSTQSILTVSDASRIVLPPRGSDRYIDSVSNLNYYGGPVMNSPNIYVVFWGWGSDPAGEQAYLTKFLNGIGGSAWLNTVTQYSSTAGPIVNSAGQLKGTWSDPSSVPRHPTDYQVAVEAYYATQHFGAAGPDTAIIVATPTGHYTRGFGTQWCAYHNYATTYSGTVINYTNLPYMTDAGQGCGMNAVNSGSAGLLDGVSIVAGHEVAESETDPEPSSGWLDRSGSEIGDKCAWINMADTTLSTGNFAVQPLWSNAKSGCVLHTP